MILKTRTKGINKKIINIMMEEYEKYTFGKQTNDTRNEKNTKQISIITNI